MTDAAPSRPLQPRAWTPRSLALILLAWLLLQFSGLFSPGLLDDVDSVYIQIAREMLARHDFVTPTIDGIRFFDKPPLMYWLASGSMALFGVRDWAARLPLAFGTLALFLSAYGLGIRLFRAVSPSEAPDRGGLYAALALATSIGPYLYTRFFIPDILIALWLTLAVHLTLIAFERLQQGRSALLPCLAFAAVLAANLLTKGLIGLVFPLAFVFLYATLTRQLRLLPRLHLLPSTALFLALALPWHLLAAARNPAIPMPPGVGLPARAGWAWFYLYNEHIARFLSKRIPHDYGQTPVWLFWLYTAIWMMPWTTFILPTLKASLITLKTRAKESNPGLSESKGSLSGANDTVAETTQSADFPLSSSRTPALTLLLWPAIVLGFFTLSARQEYYSLPALPALALLVGGFLALAEYPSNTTPPTRLALLALQAQRSAQTWTTRFLFPLTTAIAALCTFFALTAKHPAPGTDLATLLATNPELYNLSLGHLFDLTGAAMGLFRAPLAATAAGMLLAGLGSYLLRRAHRPHAATLTLAAGMAIVLLAAHEGLTRFNPILGSKGLAEAINQVRQPTDLILLDGELTSGSTLLFYTGQPVHLVNGRVNGPWFGSFWPDAPKIFETDDTLRQLWASNRRLFLLTDSPTRAADLSRFAPVHTLATAGGKTILTNR